MQTRQPYKFLVQLPVSLKRELRQYARDKKITMAQAVRQAIKRMVRRRR